MKGLGIFLGLLLLLPGVCSLLSTPPEVAIIEGLREPGYARLGLLIWLAGLVIGLGGIFLIYWAHKWD